MTKTINIFPLFVIIFTEGYIVLSSELLAIRQTLPYVGSGTDTISIIIAAVLMPLAFGYYSGGNFTSRSKNHQYKSIRKKLIQNIIISTCFLIPCLSYSFLTEFFPFLIKHGINDRIILTTLYSLLFLVTPVFLLGQTIPLISNYFSKEKLAKITGRMLFFSTLGSFMGSIISTLVLMSLFGVNYTVCVVFALLMMLVILLSKNKTSKAALLMAVITGIGFYINSSNSIKHLNIVENNIYNTVQVFEKGNSRFLVLNNNSSSKYTDTGRKHLYIEFVEKLVIKPVKNANPPKDILVIGAGGFTFGFEDKINIYDYIDIDGDLKEIAEKYILKAPLLKNKNFHPMPIRAFLSKTKKKYDIVFIDVFNSGISIPEHLVTQEFFRQIKNHLKDKGIVVSNFTSSPNFANHYSQRLDNTFRSIFPHVSRHVLRDNYKPWNNNKNALSNIIYIYRHQPNADINGIYTDNKNNSFYDRTKKTK